MKKETVSVPLPFLLEHPHNKYFLLDATFVKDITHKLAKQLKSEAAVLNEITKHTDYLYHICTDCVELFEILKIKNLCLYPKNVSDGGLQSNYFYVKFKRCSDAHSCWLTEESVRNVNPKLLQRFMKNYEGEEARRDEDGEDEGGEEEEEEEESLSIERVLAFKKSIANSNKTIKTIAEDLLGSVLNQPSYNNYKFLVKWENRDYSHCSWEDEFIVMKFPDKLKKFLDRKANPNFPALPFAGSFKKPNSSKLPQKLQKQPAYIEGTLYDYQLDGLSWLISCYHNGNNAILADEMGLGKTIQTLSFLKYLVMEVGSSGPFLIISPTTTIYNWYKEALRWVSNLDTIVYAGSKDARNNIMKLEFFKKKPGKKSPRKKPKFHVLITSYSSVNLDFAKLKNVAWEAIVIDEAQRLKNSDSKTFKICNELDAKFRLLLTGTPIQNNIDELHSLVKAIIPNKQTLERLETLGNTIVSKGGEEGKQNIERENAVKEFKKILQNHMLRRTVQDVNLKFPEFEEKVVKIPLTNVQKTLYKNILVKNYKLLSNVEAIMGKQTGKGRKSAENNNIRLNINNILMSLRLVCNHPDLFYNRYDNMITADEDFETSFLNNSNKLRFLDRVLPKLFAQGHKMLIFSQFVMMLDIVENYLIEKEINYQRLDGTTKQSERQKIIDSFNEGNAKIFLLSTRAGGLGINLTSADTIIFLDSDYNPYQDMQALARAYRIGQKNKVVVYRLVSSYTVEEKIVENAAKKLMLGELFVNPAEDNRKLSTSTVESILRFGAKELFEKQDDKMQDEEDLTDEKINDLLNRESKSKAAGSVIKAGKDLNDVYLKGFNVINFSPNPILETPSTEDAKEKKYWESLLAPGYAEGKYDEGEELGKGKRQRKHIQMNWSQDFSDFDSDESYDLRIDLEADSVMDNVSVGSNPKNDSDSQVSSKGRMEEEDPKSLPEDLQAIFGEFVEEFKKIQRVEFQDEQLAQFMLGLDKGQRLKFLEFVLKFGIYFPKFHDFHKAYCDYLEPVSHFLSNPSSSDLKKYIKGFFGALLMGDESENMNSKFYFFSADRKLVLNRIFGMFLLFKKLPLYAKKPDNFKVNSKGYKKMMKSRPAESSWKALDDYNLMTGITKHGFGSWEQIIRDPELWKTDSQEKKTEEEVKKLNFIKITGKKDLENIPEETITNYLKDYLCMRANKILEGLLEEDHKKKDN